MRRPLPVPPLAQSVLTPSSPFKEDWIKRTRASRNMSTADKSGRNLAPGLAKLPKGSFEERKATRSERIIQNRELF